MDASWDIGSCLASVEIEGELYSSDPDPRKPGCNSFEAEESDDGARHVSTGNVYQHITSADYKFFDCGPCAPANYGGGYGGRNIRFDVPSEAGNPRASVTMKIPRATAGTYRLKFWFALERDALTDPPVTATVNINNALEQPLMIYPTLMRTSSTVNDSYEVVADLIAGDNTVTVIGPDFGASPVDKDTLRFDRVTVEKLDGTTGP
jgi:hypothetical protein